jgi:hypothetical protein
LPINWRGETRCKLKLSPGDTGFTIEGDSIQVEQIDLPRYIKHVRK